jgi:hypothetical protein
MLANSAEALIPADSQLAVTPKCAADPHRLLTDTPTELPPELADVETRKASTVASRLCLTLTEKLNSANTHGNDYLVGDLDFRSMIKFEFLIPQASGYFEERSVR